MAKVAVVIVIGIDDNLLQDNLGIHHDDLKRMVPGWDAWERSIKPTHIVEDSLRMGR